MNPEIKLVARPPTTEAVEEIAADVNGEATVLRRANAFRTERAGTTPLRTELDDRLVLEKFQHLADGDSASDRRIVESAHGLRALVPPFLVVPCLAWRVACCSAR